MLHINGLSLYLEDHGSGKPVLLLHGWPDSAYLWRNQIPFLVNNGFRAIAPDLRGFGRSDRPEGVAAYSLQNAVGDVIGILDAFSIDAADIVGHDWGAAVAWSRLQLIRIASASSSFCPSHIHWRRGRCGSVKWLGTSCSSSLRESRKRGCSTKTGPCFGNWAEATVMSIVISRICHGQML